MPTVSELGVLARQSIGARSPERAIELGMHVLSYYPKAIDACCVLGLAYALRGEVRKAGDYFKLVLSADSEDQTALAGLGAAYKEEGRSQEAMALFQWALDLQPDGARLRREVLGLSRLCDAIPRDRLKPTRGGLGRIYLRSGLYDRAAKELAVVLAAEPDRLDVAAGLAESLWRAERYGEAAQVCNGILDLAPDCLKAKLLLAEMGMAG
ncbi:MAG: tetratricopeptide repeat protein, partial [Dehalococcoidia bacterium]|nr:tetratricopeptide repeat protein [Dehalococcoidia bacterium]